MEEELIEAGDAESAAKAATIRQVRIAASRPARVVLLPLVGAR